MLQTDRINKLDYKKYLLRVSKNVAKILENIKEDLAKANNKDPIMRIKVALSLGSGL